MFEFIYRAGNRKFSVVANDRNSAKKRLKKLKVSKKRLFFVGEKCPGIPKLNPFLPLSSNDKTKLAC